IHMISDESVSFEQFRHHLEFLNTKICMCNLRFDKISIKNIVTKSYMTNNEKSKLLFESCLKPILEGKTGHDIMFIHSDNCYKFFRLMEKCLLNNDIDTFDYIYTLAKRYGEKKSLHHKLKLSIENDGFDQRDTFETTC